MHTPVESAKVAVGAYINNAITRAGLAAIAAGEAAPIAMLPSPEAK